MTYTKNYGNRYSINWYVVEWAVGLSNVIHMQGNLLNQFNLLSVKKLKINAVFCLLYDTPLFWWEGEDTRTHTHTKFPWWAALGAECLHTVKGMPGFERAYNDNSNIPANVHPGRQPVMSPHSDGVEQHRIACS